MIYQFLSLATGVLAVTRALEGTWSSKSKTVVTGPAFFNPLTDSLFEPNQTGISYSFTADGYYESAMYTITANPTSPECPTGVLQWAHGIYTLPADGSILMVPIAVDGRQLLSQPCVAETSTYIRYSVNDTMQSYSIDLDGYRGEWKLTLNRLYGNPVQPLYLLYDPPQMLPTTTLLPTATAKSNKKRSLPEGTTSTHLSNLDGLNLAWYGAISMLTVGGMAFICT